MTLKENVLINFKLYFGSFYQEMIDFEQYESDSWIVTLKDGSKFVYDEFEETLRKIPIDKNDLSVEECSREFGRKLRKILFKKGMTQNELGELTGIRQRHISNYVTGKVNPTFYVVDKIAKALKVSTDELRYF